MSTESSTKLRPLGLISVTTLSAALIGVLATRPLPEAAASGSAETGATGETQTEGADGTKTGEAGETKTEGTGGSATNTNTDAPTPGTEAAVPEAPAPEAREAGRPLRVVGLGWELLAPGLLANDGLAPGPDSQFRSAGLELEFAVALDANELEARLARGGGVDNGADVAVLPLPTFVASYEQLQALRPEVFFVLGWSRGRDALAGAPTLLTDGSATRLGTGKAGSIELVGTPGQAATMLSLFALAEAGVDTARIELVPPASEAAKKATLRAVERSLVSPSAALGVHLDARDLVLTSADAPRLIPMVAVAPAGFVHANTDDLARFARVWLAGTEGFAADVPAAARRIAAEKGAPEAVALLEMMGYVGFADLADGARLAGLSGRGAVSLELLFQRSWELWREVGVLSTPAPEHAPLDNSVLARVALGEGAPTVIGRRDPLRDGDHLVLVHPVPATDDLDEAALVAEIGLLAGTFARADLELRVRADKATTRRIVAEAIERFDLDPDHVRAGPRLRGKTGAEIRVAVP